MRDGTALLAALLIVEEKLREPMTADTLAKACHSSCSGLQKLFGYAFHCSVSEYITKRRLSCASRELIESEKHVTEIALDYQYGSPEAFSRAFKRFWGVSPSEFRRTRRFFELQPPMKIETLNGGIIMSRRKPVDIASLYDEMKKLGGTYLLSMDLNNFDKVNKNHGYATGDLVIAETFARIEQEIGEDMLLFRTGGDEFAVVTALTSLAEAQALARKITARNGEVSGSSGIPISLRIGISRVPAGNLKYKEALEIMEHSVERARVTGEDIAVFEKS